MCFYEQIINVFHSKRSHFIRFSCGFIVISFTCLACQWLLSFASTRIRFMNDSLDYRHSKMNRKETTKIVNIKRNHSKQPMKHLLIEFMCVFSSAFADKSLFRLIHDYNRYLLKVVQFFISGNVSL